MSEKYRVENIKPVEAYYLVVITGEHHDGNYSTKTAALDQEEFDLSVDDLILIQNKFSKRHELEKYNPLYFDELPQTEYGVACTLEALYVLRYNVDGTCDKIVLTTDDLVVDKLMVEYNKPRLEEC